MTKEQFEKRRATVTAAKEILDCTTPAGAFAIGMVCAIAWERGAEPMRSILEHVGRYFLTVEASSEFQQLHAQLHPARHDENPDPNGVLG